jgi:hypothetical protein
MNRDPDRRPAAPLDGGYEKGHPATGVHPTFPYGLAGIPAAQAGAQGPGNGRGAGAQGSSGATA